MKTRSTPASFPPVAVTVKWVIVLPVCNKTKWNNLLDLRLKNSSLSLWILASGPKVTRIFEKAPTPSRRLIDSSQ